MTMPEWLSRLLDSPALMERMMARFGVRERLRGRPHAAEVTRRAAIRCGGCGDKRECEEWLDAGAQGDAVPSFCRNSDLIERLRRETA